MEENFVWHVSVFWDGCDVIGRKTKFFSIFVWNIGLQIVLLFIILQLYSTYGL